jgi:1,2-diacylglycerol 3-beta-glucosyltransferase
MPVNAFSDDQAMLEAATDRLDLTSSLDYERYIPHRRRKAAVLLVAIWGVTMGLHLTPWGLWLVWSLSGILGIQALRILAAQPASAPVPLDPASRSTWPLVSLLVAAKNEQAVVTRLVNNLCQLDYPSDRYEVWIIDDNSTDETPRLLAELQQIYPQLKVFRRGANAGGGKSGALNQVWPLTKGEFLAIFDADAQVAPDLLRRAIPLFGDAQVGAVQVRKAIANADANFLTRGQWAEMTLDAYYQQQRVTIGGLGELRGNGQFLRREALERCGGFNEQTITDDLDLTLRLHLDHWEIAGLFEAPVQEEGVTSLKALWHQRRRWAEGGYQRYLDYWPYLVSGRLNDNKTLDLFAFWLLQYCIPTAGIPDLLMALWTHQAPLLSPLAGLTFGLTMTGIFCGLRQEQRLNGEPQAVLGNLLQALLRFLYMLHWLPIMAYTTARMAIVPKQLKWVKTVHVGEAEVA